jgi:hypothetical protein
MYNVCQPLPWYRHVSYNHYNLGAGALSDVFGGCDGSESEMGFVRCIEVASGLRWVLGWRRSVTIPRENAISWGVHILVLRTQVFPVYCF